MINVIIGIALLIVIVTIDFEVLKQEKSLKAWLTYGGFSGIGVSLFVLYNWTFALPSPLNFVIKWLHPITGWLNK